MAILAVRTALGMSLRELARLSGTSAGYLGQVERGEREPSERWRRAVTTALGEAMASGRRGAA